MRPLSALFFFFFNDTATTEIYTLSLHDALPIFPGLRFTAIFGCRARQSRIGRSRFTARSKISEDRKSTRLNSSHLVISYAVFCLKKKNNDIKHSHAHIQARSVADSETDAEAAVY